MIAAEIQSWGDDGHEHDQGYDRGQQKLWQVQREVAVERVQPACASTVSSPVFCVRELSRPSIETRSNSARRSCDFA